MKNKYAKFLFSIVFMSFIFSFSGAGNASYDESSNYLNIRRHYYKWDQGPDGSTGYFRKMLYSYLIEMIGRDIKTDYDYIPEYTDERTHESKFRFGEWLVISGIINEENIKDINSLRKKYGGNSQPGKGLFSISGRIRKFRLSDYSGKRKVYLYLDEMKLKNVDVINN